MVFIGQEDLCKRECLRESKRDGGCVRESKCVIVTH